MKTTAKKKPAIKVRAHTRKSATTAPAARVPVVAAVKVYPHVLHVHVNGQEDPARRIPDPQTAEIKALAEKLAAEFPGTAVTVEFLDNRGQKRPQP